MPNCGSLTSEKRLFVHLERNDMNDTPTLTNTTETGGERENANTRYVYQERAPWNNVNMFAMVTHGVQLLAWLALVVGMITTGDAAIHGADPMHAFASSVWIAIYLILVPVVLVSSLIEMTRLHVSDSEARIENSDRLNGITVMGISLSFLTCLCWLVYLTQAQRESLFASVTSATAVVIAIVLATMGLGQVLYVTRPIKKSSRAK